MIDLIMQFYFDTGIGGVIVLVLSCICAGFLLFFYFITIMMILSWLFELLMKAAGWIKNRLHKVMK